MPKAFVMMNVKVGTDPEVVEALRRMEHITGVFEVYSVYDIVVEVEAGTLEELQEIIALRIRKLENVMSTHTMIVAK